MKTNKLVGHSFVDDGRRCKIPGLEIKDYHSRAARIWASVYFVVVSRDPILVSLTEECQVVFVYTVGGVTRELL